MHIEKYCRTHTNTKQEKTFRNSDRHAHTLHGRVYDYIVWARHFFFYTNRASMHIEKYCGTHTHIKKKKLRNSGKHAHTLYGRVYEYIVWARQKIFYVNRASMHIEKYCGTYTHTQPKNEKYWYTHTHIVRARPMFLNVNRWNELGPDLICLFSKRALYVLALLQKETCGLKECANLLSAFLCTLKSTVTAHSRKRWDSKWSSQSN